MTYNFDEIVDRRGTDALKVEALPVRWGAVICFRCGSRIWI